MNKFRETVSRKQQTLLPRSVEEFVPTDDSVRYIDSLIDELNLSEIEDKYSTVGRPAFNPVIMVKLLVYGKIRGIRSSRQLSQACRENLKFIFITNGEQPDFRTISLFRQRFCKELANILQQTIVIGLETEVIDLKHVAIDGTLLKSFAGKGSYKTPTQIAKEVEELEKLIKQDIEQDEASDEEDDDDTDKKLPKRLRDPEKLKEKLKSALSKYEEFKNRPKRDWPKKISVTDPDSRYMRKGPAYNGQAAVDENSRMVVAGFTTDAVADSSQLIPILEEIELNTKKNPTSITADTGYSARNALKELKQRDITGYVAQRENTSKGFPFEKFKYDKNNDTYTCPNNKILKYLSQRKEARIYKANKEDCKCCPLRPKCSRFPDSTSPRNISSSIYNDLVIEMRERTQSKTGTQMARKRSSTVETIFAHIKYARKFRQFIFRGMNMVNNMWKFELAVYNLEQLMRLRKQGIITS